MSHPMGNKPGKMCIADRVLVRYICQPIVSMIGALNNTLSNRMINPTDASNVERPNESRVRGLKHNRHKQVATLNRSGVSRPPAVHMTTSGDAAVTAKR